VLLIHATIMILMATVFAGKTGYSVYPEPSNFFFTGIRMAKTLV
jgi:hypothetical protein